MPSIAMIDIADPVVLHSLSPLLFRAVSRL